MGHPVLGHQEACSEEQTHGRTGRRHQEFPPGGAALRFGGGDAPQEKQRDAAHPDPLLHRHDGMAQFMQHHGSREQQGGDHRERPQLPGLQLRAQGILIPLEEESRKKHHQHKPGGVEPHRDPADPHQFPALAHS